jgi:hypothetical protein
MQALRACVEKRVELLDAGFLAAIGAYKASAEARGDRAVVVLFAGIREATLAAVASRMPASMQVLKTPACSAGPTSRAVCSCPAPSAAAPPSAAGPSSSTPPAPLSTPWPSTTSSSPAPGCPPRGHAHTPLPTYPSSVASLVPSGLMIRV